MVSVRFRPSLLAVALVASLAGGAATAHADSTMVDFETGPPADTVVTDQYKTSNFVQWLVSDGNGRPERRSRPALARSGTFVADVGGDTCGDEEPSGNSCEFPHIASTARLTRTATAVTLYAGMFNRATGVGAQLTGYNAAGQQVAQSPVVPLPPNDTSGEISPGGHPAARAFVIPQHKFTTPITISVPDNTTVTQQIARFRLDAVDSPAGTNSSQGAELGYDDLTLNFPANSLPDVSLGSQSVAAVLDGLTTDVPVSVTRLNGSDGPLAMNVTGLPTGVTATVSPNPVPTGSTTATVHFTASATAPRIDNLADVTVTADPQNNGNVAPGPRDTHVGLRVASPFDLKGPQNTDTRLYACGDTDVPIVVARDSTFTGTVTLALGALPDGVTASILPSATVAPGGGFNADRTIRFHMTPGAILTGFHNVFVTATSPGSPTRTYAFTLARGNPTASISGNTAVTVPEHLQPGTMVTLSGTGFCPGTTVQTSGSAATPVATTVAADGKSLTFETPRTAEAGTVRVFAPNSDGGYFFDTTNALQVDDFINSVGFAFHNPGFGLLSYGELTDAFGNDDMWITVNPCWPWGSCRVNTGIPDPLSYAVWVALNPILRSSGGHCFGITVAAEKFRRGEVPYSRFQSGVSHSFDLASSAGPGDALGSFLDGQHALQASAEYLSAYAHRDRNISGQLGTLRSELALNRDPIVAIHHPGGVFGEGHALLAYDQKTLPNGDLDIYVYDSNRQGRATGNGGSLNDSVIHIFNGGHSWSFKMADGTNWGSNDDGSLFISPQYTIPSNPSLPGLSSLLDLPALILGSGDGSATVTSATPGATTSPIIDGDGPANSAGTVIGTTPGQPLSATVEGTKDGTYSSSITSPGFTGTVTDVATKAGVKDITGGNGQGHDLTFTSGEDRPLTMTVGTTQATGKASRAADGAADPTGPSYGTSATITTHASKGGNESAGLTAGGTLSYEHTGKPTSMSFTITKVTENGGPVQFASPSVPVAGGDKVTVTPTSTLASASVTIRGKNGKTTRRTLKNKAKVPGRLKLGKVSAPKATGAATRTVHLSATISKVAAGSTAAYGVSLRLFRGKHVVASHTASSGSAANGATPITWTLPSLPKGSYKLVVNGRLSVSGPASGSATAQRTAALKLP